MDKYEDIINLPHHVSATRPQMSMLDRAAQFSPFAALTGYDEAVKETARLTDARIELDDSTKIILSDKLQMAMEMADQEPTITVTYFVPDQKKAGGAYVDYTGIIKRIDEYERKVIFVDKTSIPIDDIYAIEGEIYKGME